MRTQQEIVRYLQGINPHLCSPLIDFLEEEADVRAFSEYLGYITDGMPIPLLKMNQEVIIEQLHKTVQQYWKDLKRYKRCQGSARFCSLCCMLMTVKGIIHLLWLMESNISLHCFKENPHDPAPFLESIAAICTIYDWKIIDF